MPYDGQSKQSRKTLSAGYLERGCVKDKDKPGVVVMQARLAGSDVTSSSES